MAASKEESSAHQTLSLEEALGLVSKMPWSNAFKLLSLLKEHAAKKDVSGKPFLLLSYQYGECIVDNGQFCLPDAVKTHPNASALLKTFGSNGVPLAFLVDNPIEVFESTETTRDRGHDLPHSKPYVSAETLQKTRHTRPLRIFLSGQLIGIFQLVDKLLGSCSQIAKYSLSAGEISIHFGVPTNSTMFSDAIAEFGKRNKIRITWKYWNEHSLLVKEIVARAQWKCTIVLVPDNLCSLSKSHSEVKNMLLMEYCSQMSQVKDDMNERGYLRKLDGMTQAELYHEQIGYLLGIVRGEIPAMVPWQKSAPQLPLDPIVEHLCDYLQDKKDGKYYPFIMVPRLLEKGQQGFFSCKWNVGPTVCKEFAPRQTQHIFELMKRCVPDLFPTHQAEELVKPFLSSNRIKGLEEFVKDCAEVSDSEFIPLQHNSKLKLWRGNFLNSGFVITRPKWL